jgi:uncharacterized membrane protein YphA (DoxX/SURF4 family)
MLSIFPELLSYGIVSTTIIRILIGVCLIFFGYITLFKKKDQFSEKMETNNYPFGYAAPWIFGLAEFIVGTFLILGFLTQIAAIISAYIFLNLSIIENDKREIFKQTPLFYIVLIIISLSLLLSGPGIFAIDFPL